jgi:hypothetical protein
MLGFLLFPLFVFGQFVPFAFFSKQDPCRSNPTMGTVCLSGVIYAGEFDGGRYHVTPAGCNDSSTPACDGSTETLTKAWYGSSGSTGDIPGVETLFDDTTSSSSSYRGDVNTAAMVAASAVVSADSAAHYCNDMIFGGYSDWYLPSRSELVHLYCHSDSSSHNVNFPEEDPNCVANGGKSSELTGFLQNWYFSSTEYGGISAWGVNFSTGEINHGYKSQFYNVRCVRRF